MILLNSVLGGEKERERAVSISVYVGVLDTSQQCTGEREREGERERAVSLSVYVGVLDISQQCTGERERGREREQ